MSTSGGGLLNLLLYVLELGLAVQLATAFPRSWGRRHALGFAVLWMVVAVPSLLQFAFPGLFRALRRDPSLIRDHGQVWRLVTSVVVQDGGLGGTIFNLATLAMIGTLAVQFWGPGRAIGLFVAAHLVFNVPATFLSTDVGAGNSGATFGLAATLAGAGLVRYAAERPRRWGILGRAAGVLLTGAVLVALRDAHGIPMLGGVLLGAAASRRHTPA